MSNPRHDAIVRLVQALNRQQQQQQHTATNNDTSLDDESSVDLAIRIMESQLGASSFESSSVAVAGTGVGASSLTSSSATVFSPAWKRRIQNYFHGGHHELEHLYGELVDACHSNSNNNNTNRDDALPAKLMEVLTKCIGNKAKENNALGNADSTSFAASSVAASTTGFGSSRLQSQQQHPKITMKSVDPSSDRNHNHREMAALSSRMDADSTQPFSLPLPRRSVTASSNANHGQHHNIDHALQYEEQQILRELLYALQGIEGERIKFYVHDNNNNNNNEDNRNAYYEKEDPLQYGDDCMEGIRIVSPALQGASKLQQQQQQQQYYNYHQSSLLGSGAMDALRICGEAGWLVRRLQRYVDAHLGAAAAMSGGGAGGQVARALARSVAQELQAYHDCLGRWEEHLGTWSLRQWLVQIQRHPVLQRLTVLAMLTEALPSQPSNGIGVGGGTLLSALHAHSLHGDSRHKSLVQSILYPTSQPWFHMLYLWTTQGLLPASWGGDFFVTLQHNYGQHVNSFHQNFVTGRHHAGRNHNTNNEDNKYLWHDKYTLDKAQIPHPGIFDPDLVKPAFVIGKGINFIRSCLNQVGWTLKFEDETMAAKVATTTFSADNSAQEDEFAVMERLGYHFVPDPRGMHLNPRLTKTLLQAEKLVHSHILQSLRKDHNLLDHLFALKQFLLHGQGDFFSSLLEGLYTDFGCGTKTAASANVNTSFVAGHAVAGVYPQQLLAIMETALRQTNAKDLPVFCLERLRVEMLPFDPEQDSGLGLFTSPSRNISDIHENDSTQDNRSVYDIFVLDYTVPDPLIAIVHEKALAQYKQVYSFLFGLRKIEFMLHRTWRQSATLQHALQRMAQNNGLQTSSSVGYASATVLLRKVAMTRQTMTHFCVNMKSYCMLEVLEGEWKELLQRLEQARTLDEAIQAHDYYLEGICRKTLLSTGRRKRIARSGDGQQSNTKFRNLFSNIVSIATEFCALQERLFDEALEAAERVAQRRREAEQRMTHGQWGFENEEDLKEEEAFFGLADSSELTEVIGLSEAFDQCMQTFLEALDAKVHGRSRNMSTSADLNDNDDVDFSENEESAFFDFPGEEQDVDSLRFLIHQLDYNHFYGLLHRH